MVCEPRWGTIFVCCLLLLFCMYSSVAALRLARRTFTAPVRPSTFPRVHNALFCTESTSAGTEKKKQKGKASAQVTVNVLGQGIDDIKRARVTKMEQLKSMGKNPFAYSYEQTHKAAELHALCKDLPDGAEDENLRVSISGRIMLRRVFGKLAFFHLQDESGQIQLYIDKARLADDSFDQLKALTDAGDIIGVKGTMKRTDKVG
jgi:hypothetical protein